MRADAVSTIGATFALPAFAVGALAFASGFGSDPGHWSTVARVAGLGFMGAGIGLGLIAYGWGHNERRWAVGSGFTLLMGAIGVIYGATLSRDVNDWEICGFVIMGWGVVIAPHLYAYDRATRKKRCRLQK